ncbi:helix-turn-helix domain-containing protein [Halomicrococcus sp. SG-WS-1]|uniref:helix-turn-helix domain-containing protein n=1 Tax=Halomicrococcus sp. SG-WS-1 TaxID=3439057 RepID=UPI003F7A06AD
MREAEIHIPDEALESLGLGDFISLCREARLRDLVELQCRGDGCLWAVTVASSISEERLAELDVVEWWEELNASGEDIVYLCKVGNLAAENSMQSPHEMEISQDDIQVGSNGIDVSLIGTQNDISRSVDEHEDAGMNVFLRRITDYTGPDHPLDSLTDRQRGVLTTAFDMGYFAVPREATTEDVAAAVELDPSTVREHLQRAQHNVLTELLGSA